MALVSDIEIRLRADIARLQQDLDRARQQVGGAMNRIADSVKTAAKAFATLAAGFAVGAFAGWIKSAIDATDVASDLAQRTGIAVEQLAGLQLWFQIGGAEAGEFEASMIKLSKTIVNGEAAFKSIGVATRNADGTLRSNVQVLLDSGDAFAKMEDSTAKTAKAIELFGKSGAVLIPILNSGSAGLREMTEMADKLGLTFNQKTVDAAGQFNDTLDFLSLASQGLGRQVAAELLPALNSLVGTMLKVVTEGNAVKETAQAIAGGFKVLYSAGVIVTALFKTVGDSIAGSLASSTVLLRGVFDALLKLRRGDITGAWESIKATSTTTAAILKDTWGGTTGSIKSAAQSISDVWNEANGEAVAALAAATKGTKVLSDEEKKAAAQREKAYADFSKTLDQRVAETALEAKMARDLTEAEKLEIKVKQMVAEGTIVLNVAQQKSVDLRIAQIAANNASIESQKAYAKMLEDTNGVEKEIAKTLKDKIDKAKEEVKANQELALTVGKTKTQIEKLELARLKEQLAQRSSLGLTLDEIENLEQLIVLKERSVAAVARTEELEKIKDFWESIEKTAHDTFVSIADGGKNAFQRLKETAKNIFFDWLYQQTLKKWIINIQAQGTGNPLQSLLGNNSLTAGSSLLKTIGSTVASYVVGSTLNKTISGGYETGSGFMAVQKIATAVGSVFSPVVGGIVGAVSGLINRAFGMKPKQYADASNLVGTLGTGGFSGTVNTAWTQKGGWFRSNKSGTDKAAVDLATASGLVAAYDAIKATSADFARVLGLNADSIANRTQALNIQLGKDEAANQKAIADFFLGVGDTIARELLPTIGQFQQAGESAADAFQRVATGFQVVDAMLVGLSTDSQTAFRAVGVASLEARERLIALAGGIDALATQVQFFSDNFLTRAEQVAPLQKQVNEQLAALGYAGITTADQFKVAVQNLVNSGALATESGAKTYAALLQLGPMFKTVADYLAEVNEAAKQMLRDRADAAIETLGRSVDAQKDIVTKAYNDAMGVLETRADALNETIERTASLSQALKDALRGVDTPANQAAARQAAQAQIGAALAIAKAGGVLPSADDLRGALATLQQDSTGQFSTLAAYQREVARTNAQLVELGGLSDDQLSIAERQLRALNEQRETSKVAYDMEIARLDGLLITAQNELNAINGVNMSVLTVTAAVNQVQEALNALRTVPNPGAIGVPVAYAPPATKFEVPAPTYTAASGTMPSSQAMLNALQNMDTRLANMEIAANRTANATTQFAGQFDQSSGGGNALLVQQA